MQFDSGLGVLEKKKNVPQILSGDDTLDELIGGGFHKDLVYLLFGDKRKTSDILLKTSVYGQLRSNSQALQRHVQIAFIDGNNRFNPYNVSKLAVSLRLSPTKVLENILIARAFTWEQMVELLENRISQLENVKIVLISGITSLFPNYQKESFEGLLKAIGGIKNVLSAIKPLIVITSPLNIHSLFKPQGGKILSHFGQVLVLITDTKRNTEYVLIQHPSLPERR
ncbi:unnamed protein product, partial [marine sediment metagenome]